MATHEDRTERCPACGGRRAAGRACPRCMMQLGLDDSRPPPDSTLGPEPSARGDGGLDLGIANFRVIEKLGEGGMGEVFAAEQLAPVRRPVALKVIKWGMDTAEVVARFESERQALALMNHSAIARVFEAGATAAGRPFFAMELVDGEPITQYCDAHRLTTYERIELFLQVCRGVHHAHRRGVIHRDLKPSNILVSGVDEAPIVKVIDFGIAKATEQHLTEHTVFTQQGLLIGTPEYMSPEQAELSTIDVDTRSDVYSLGVLLYELLTGELPLDRDSFRQGSILDIQRRILEQDPPRPSTRFDTRDERSNTSAARRRTDVRSLRRHLAGDLDWIVMKALEKNPERRYATAAHLRRDLERYLEDEPVSAGPPSVSYRLRKFTRRHRIAVTAASLVLAALVLGLVAAVTGLVRAREAEAVASAERDKAEAINQFLVEMLGSANPYAETGRDVTVVETLDASVTRLDDAFADQPEVRNELQLTIGSSYTLLGAYDKAEPVLRATLADRLERYPDDDPRVAAAENALGVLLTQGSEFEEGAELLRRALATRRAKLGPTSDEATTSATNLSMALSRLAEYDEAARLLEETIEHRRAVGAAPEKIGVVYNNLGIILRRAGRLQEAEEAHLQGLELRIAGHGPYHPHVAESLGNLAAVYRQQERLDEAEEHYLRSLEVLTVRLGPDHSRVGTLYNNLGGLYYGRGDHGRARELYEEAWRITSSHFERDHPAMASLLNNIANVENELGNYEAAAAGHREALEIRHRLFGEVHPSVAISLAGLASALCEGGDPAQAIPYYEESVSINAQTLGRENWRTARVESAFGECLRLAGEHDRAEDTLTHAIPILEHALGPEHRETRLGWKRFAAVYEDQRRFDLAHEYLARLETRRD